MCPVAVILAIETSSANAGIALRMADGGIALRTSGEQRRQAEWLLPAIAEVLAAAATSLPRIEAIAFGCGPGSFTGVRLGASVAQGLGMALGVPLLPVGSLDVLAAGAGDDGDVAVAVDGRMGDVYFARYRLSAGTLTTLERPNCVRSDGFVGLTERVRNYLGRGDGWAITGMPDAALRSLDVAATASARDLLLLGERAFAAGEAMVATHVELDYLRPASAWRLS